MRLPEIQPRRPFRPPHLAHAPHPPHPSGPVVGRFRSLTLDWTDPESGQLLRGQIEAPDGFLDSLAELAPQGLRVGPVRPASTPGHGTFRVRVSPGRRLPGGRNGL